MGLYLFDDYKQFYNRNTQGGYEHSLEQRRSIRPKNTGLLGITRHDCTPAPAQPLRPHLRLQSSPPSMQIRTNQKHALSLHSSHGFLRAHSQLEVAVKIIDKPNAAIPLKL
jgi:hypothetical protein